MVQIRGTTKCKPRGIQFGRSSKRNLRLTARESSGGTASIETTEPSDLDVAFKQHRLWVLGIIERRVIRVSFHANSSQATICNDFPATRTGVGTDPALHLPDLTERSEPGVEEMQMGKKFSRSLQDDAYAAEESVSRRTRVMGQQFVDAHDDEPAIVDEVRRSESDADPTEDPVRMYLMQMGQIPLLTRDQEVAAAKQIERTRERIANGCWQPISCCKGR